MRSCSVFSAYATLFVSFGRWSLLSNYTRGGAFLLYDLSVCPRLDDCIKCVGTAMDVDEVFERIGELGPAQWKLLVLLSLPVMWAAFHAFVTNFIGTDPGWSCSIDIPDPSRLIQRTGYPT